MTSFKAVSVFLFFCFEFIAYFLKPQNMKFFKITEIWYRGVLLYAYNDFNAYFFKIFVIHIFWANLVPKSEVLQIN